MSDTIKLYKLPSGQEIIGRLVEEGSSWVVLEHVLTFRVVQQGPDQYGLQLNPLSPTLPEGKWRFNYSQLLSEAVDVPDSMAKAYLQQVSSIQIISSLDEMERMS